MVAKTQSNHLDFGEKLQTKTSQVQLFSHMSKVSDNRLMGQNNSIW